MALRGHSSVEPSLANLARSLADLERSRSRAPCARRCRRRASAHRAGRRYASATSSRGGSVGSSALVPRAACGDALEPTASGQETADQVPRAPGGAPGRTRGTARARARRPRRSRSARAPCGSRGIPSSAGWRRRPRRDRARGSVPGRLPAAERNADVEPARTPGRTSPCRRARGACAKVSAVNCVSALDPPGAGSHPTRGLPRRPRG